MGRNLKRREFLKQTTLGAGVITAAPAVRRHLLSDSPNGRVNVAVVGFHNRGRDHYRGFARLSNVRVTALCDVDERLFGEAVREVEEIGGSAPKTQYDFRRLLEDKDLDAVAIATPDHWHALMTVWACQAGKDVYVEKPISYDIHEGRTMVEAARKYQRIVQVGTQSRSRPSVRAAIQFLREGKLGQVYRAKVFILKGRANIGRVPDSEVPAGVHWDLFLGPAPSRPFNLNRFHYGWHFYWDTSTSDLGNSGVHEIDIARWGLGKDQHPVRIHCSGGLYAWEDTDQETPNVQLATVEYPDGTLLDVELTNLYTNEIAGQRSTGVVFSTSEGYLTITDTVEVVKGRFVPREGDLTPAGVSERVMNLSFPRRVYEKGPDLPLPAQDEGRGDHFENFIHAVRSRRREDLHADILEGHLSTTICHLANISYRTGRKLTFDPRQEKFVQDPEADAYLRRVYRSPYVLPEKV